MADVSAAEDRKLRVFISYSRKDEDFAQELLAGLEVLGFEPYLDKHDIAAGEDWEARLGRLIEATDTVVFVISPDAVASDRCAWEVAHKSFAIGRTDVTFAEWDNSVAAGACPKASDDGWVGVIDQSST